MEKKDAGACVIRQAFLLGYAYALGYEYGRRNCLTMDDTESGKTQERNEKGEYTKESDAAPSPEKENDNSSQLITDTSPKSLDRDIKANCCRCRAKSRRHS